MSDFTPAQQEPNQSVWEPPPASTETPAPAPAPAPTDEQTEEAGRRYMACYNEAMANDQNFANPIQTAAKYIPGVGTAMDVGDCAYYGAKGQGGEAVSACGSAVLDAAGADKLGMAVNVGQDLGGAATPGSSPPVSMSTVDGKPVQMNTPGSGSISQSIASQIPPDANFDPANPHILPYKASGEPGADDQAGVCR